MARINSRQVEAFRATMLTGSVTEAAALMTVTQPAVSRLLRDLQALLKMELFERRGTGLVPTAAAMALYTEVERSFVGLERITAAAEEIRGRRTGSLRATSALPRCRSRIPAYQARNCRRPRASLCCRLAIASQKRKFSSHATSRARPSSRCRRDRRAGI